MLVLLSNCLTLKNIVLILDTLVRLISPHSLIHSNRLFAFAEDASGRACSFLAVCLLAMSADTLFDEESRFNAPLPRSQVGGAGTYEVSRT